VGGVSTSITPTVGWDELPELLDRPTLLRKVGLRRCDVDRIFDRCHEYRVAGSSKPYVHRDEARGQLVVTPPAPGRAA
jgi:hypothetical protein